MSTTQSPTKRYHAARLDPRSSFGYGLMRRSSMVLSAIERHAGNKASLDVVDFGCADGQMLFSTAQQLGRRFASGIGFDVFRSGLPEAPPDSQVRFIRADLFRDYPFALSDRSRDVAIVSAFLKHHPEPARFLAEVARILRPKGVAVVLDPRPFVVHLGALAGRFNKGYIPSLWDRKYLCAMLAAPAVRAAGRMELIDFERYWMAPTAALYRAGLEARLPSPLARLLAMHQCAVLQRMDD